MTAATVVRSDAAVVTGASSGIGAAVALRLAARGRRLVLVGRHRERLAAVAAATGGHAVTADVTAPPGRAAVTEAVEALDGRLGLLVHAAGVGAAGPFSASDPDAVSDLVAVNLTAPLLLTHALLGPLRSARGHVVLVASVAALGVAGEVAYSATKAGLRGFADALRLEGEVGVTTVLPGAVDTPFLARRGYARAVPRPVTPDRVAEAALAAVAHGDGEVFVPRWLAVASRVHGVAPGVYARLARRFG